MASLPPLRPLHEMPVADLKGIFSDLDDTLTRHGRLVPAAYVALCEAARAGLRVVVATGRPGGYAEVLATLWPVEAVVAENGAYAVLGDGRRRYWDPAEVRLGQRAKLDALVDEIEAALPFARRAEDHPLRRIDVAFDVNERRHLAPEQVQAIVARIEAAGARSLVSSIHVHAFFGDHDKAKMLARLAAELWGDSDEDVRRGYLFVGDSPNDQAGFSFFPRSAGVANVARYAAVLAPPPAFLAAGEGGDGFAEIVRLVLSRRADPVPR